MKNELRSLDDRIKELTFLYTSSSPLFDNSSVSLEFLLDSVVCLAYECRLPQFRSERNCVKFHNAVKRYVDKIESCWIKRDEFETIRLIGSGAFGEVSVVRWKANGGIYALKSLHKYDMLKRSDRACFQEERDVMVKALVQNSPWIARLHHTFQDEKFLYFLMDFYNGGDMLTMLSKFDDKIPEDIARFYVAEIVLAINSLHSLGYVHRDIKPDNVLLESSGHIVLADFGSCLKLGDSGLVKSSTAVGTPDYISPEILRATEDNHGTYGVECDFWSLGVMIYEMLFGETPFYSENLIETYGQIMNFEENFKIPDDFPEVSENARDLIRRLICDRKRRLGRAGVHEFKEHPFFNGIKWDHIRDQTPPYIPEVGSAEDTSNFDIEQSTRNHEGPPLGPMFRGCQVACIGFTFTKGSPLNELGPRNQLKLVAPSALSKEQESSSAAALADSADLSSSLAKQNFFKPPLPRYSSDFTSSSLTELDARCNAYELESSAPPEHLPEIPLTLSDVAGSTDLIVLQGEINTLKCKCLRLESENQHHLSSITSLRNELSEQRELNQKLANEIRDFEEENEVLCKRASDAQSTIRQLDAEHEKLLTDFARVQSELVSLRQLERDNLYVNSDPLITLKNDGKSFSSTPALLDGVNENGTHSQKMDSHEQLREMESRLKLTTECLANCRHELQTLKLTRQTEQREWTRDREVAEQQLEAALIDRTSALRELASLRSNYADLADSITNWESRLSELNKWADDERIAKDKLHMFTCRVVAELEALRASNLGPTTSPLTPAQQDLINHEYQNLCNGHSNLTAETLSFCLDSPPASITGDGTLDWRQRKSTKVNKMERSNLQVALNSEVRAREQAEVRIQEYEIKLREMAECIRSKDLKIEEQDRLLERLNDQLLVTSNQAPFFRVGSEPAEDGLSISPVALNSHDAKVCMHESRRSLPLVGLQNLPSLSSRVASCDAGSPASHSAYPHYFSLDTFSGPAKCRVCTGLMLGQRWQGLQCRNCGFQCHQRCRQSAPSVCPAPAAPTPQVSFDGGCGFGTVLEGCVQLPKAGGIKRGWTRHYLFLSDMRLFIFDITQDSNCVGGLSSASPAANMFPWFRVTSPNSSVNMVFTSSSPNRIADLRCPGFSVSRVTHADVIHAKRNDIPRILKVHFDDRPLGGPLFLLFDSVRCLEHWFSAIDNSVKLIQRNLLTTSETQYLQPQEACDSAFLQLKQVLCACVLDEHRILIGADDGLHVMDVKKGATVRRGDKKPVYQVEALAEELQLVVAIQEKQRRLKLFLLGTIEGMNSEPIKVSDPKSCTLFVCGLSHSNTVCLLCAAGRRSVWIIEIARVRGRHRKLREISCPDTVQALTMVRGGDWLCIGCPSYFALYPIWSEGPPQALLRTDLVDLDPALNFFQQNSCDAYLSVQVDDDEFLLVFEICGVYVNTLRQPTRSDHLMWPAKPISTNPFVCLWPYLYVFTNAGLIVYDIKTGQWITTLGGRHIQPLNPDAHLCLIQIVNPPPHTSSPSTASTAKLNVSGNSTGQPSSSPPDSNTGNQDVQRLIYLPRPLVDPKSDVSVAPPFVVLSASRCRYLELGDSLPSSGYHLRMQKSRRFTTMLRDGDASSMDNGVSSESLGSAGGNRVPRHSTLRRHSQPQNRSTPPTHRLADLISGPSNFQHVGHLGPQTTRAFLDLGPVPGQSLSSESEKIARFKSVIEDKYLTGSLGSLNPGGVASRPPPVSVMLGLSPHIAASAHVSSDFQTDSRASVPPHLSLQSPSTSTPVAASCNKPSDHLENTQT